jgi:hypothetical protein
VKNIVPILVIVVMAAVISSQFGDDENGGNESAGGASATERQVRVSGRSRCTVVAEAPTRDQRNNRITGASSYRCDRPGADVEYTVYLQRRGAGTIWTTIDSRPVAASGGDTTRDRSERQRTIAVAGACVDGTYRTFLRGTVGVDGVSTAVEAASPEATDPCPSDRAP